MIYPEDGIGLLGVIETTILEVLFTKPGLKVILQLLNVAYESVIMAFGDPKGIV